MATAHTEPKAGGSILDVMTTQIREVFERILSEVRARRDELLAQVSKIRTEFEGKNASMIENLKELEEMRAVVEKMSVKQNLAMKKQQESLADIDAEIGKLKDSLNQNSSFKFNFTQLITQVKQFGEIKNESHLASIYSKKLTAVRVIDGYKDIKFKSSNILHIDYDKELLYVVCREKNDDRFPVAIFNAKDFSFITGFGDSSYPHTCIATSKEFIYFGSLPNEKYANDMLLQYKQSDYSLVKKIAINTKCSNIAVTSENQVIVLCHSKNNFLFRTYDRALNFIKEIDLNIQSEINVRLPMQQREDQFYILHNKQLLVFNREGKNIRPLRLYNKTGESTILKNTSSFYLDEAGNIIVTDSHTNSIKFFSPAGNLFHTIGEDTVGSDEVEGVYDIIAFNGKVIVSCGDSFSGPKTIRIY